MLCSPRVEKDEHAELLRRAGQSTRSRRLEQSPHVPEDRGATRASGGDRSPRILASFNGGSSRPRPQNRRIEANQDEERCASARVRRGSNRPDLIRARSVPQKKGGYDVDRSLLHAGPCAVS